LIDRSPSLLARQRNRQTQTDRQTDRQTERQTQRETDSLWQTQHDKNSPNIYRQTHPHRQTDRHTERQTDRKLMLPRGFPHTSTTVITHSYCLEFIHNKTYYYYNYVLLSL